jgi:hypothetical protein
MPPLPESGGAGGKPPPKPPSGGQSVQGGEQPRRYPQVQGGGDVPFTPEDAPPVTQERLEHILKGEMKGHRWSGGHGPGAGKGKTEFPAVWTTDKIKGGD